jgi:hypothetical protein
MRIYSYGLYGLVETIESWNLTDTEHVQVWKRWLSNTWAARAHAKHDEKRNAKPGDKRPGAPLNATRAVHSSLTLLMVGLLI